MIEEQKTSWHSRLAAGVVLLTTNLAAGAALGLLWVKLFVQVDMGLGGVADMLGGAMAGMLLALLVSLFLIYRTSVPAQWKGSAISVVIAMLIFSGLALTAPERKRSSEPVMKEKFRPAFVLRLKVYQAGKMAATQPDTRLIPFTEAEIWTGSGKLIRTGWGADSERCVAPATNADFKTLLPLLQAVVETGSNCRTPEEDPGLSVRWNIENNRGNLNLDLGCLKARPKVAILVNAVDRLAMGLCARVKGAMK
ncbi:MAG: hypothetical protein AB2556_00050 [Candidatus Thiodiazotropha sp.]